eukprot:2325418-Rhodomonas_salina.1
MEQYGFFYVKYRADKAYWEAVVLLRKGLLAAILSAVSVPMVQAVLVLVLLNASMCAHLVHAPLIRPTAAALNNFGLFCTIVFAVFGMLFFPSLDKSVQCVGSGDLVKLHGAQCVVNDRVKLCVAVLLLSLLALAALASLSISLAEFRAKLAGERAAAAVALNYLSSSRRHRRNSITVTLLEQAGNESDGSSASGSRSSAQAAAQELLHSLAAAQPAAPPLGGRVLEWLGVRGKGEPGGGAQADPYKLQLHHMLGGAWLGAWQAALSEAVDAPKEEASQWNRVRATIGLHREELAYQKVDERLSKFATIFEHASGFYVNDHLAHFLRVMLHALPLLVDFLAAANGAHRADFEAAVLSLTLYARRHKSRAFHDLVLVEHRAAVLHWLMRCEPPQRRSFRLVFAAIASAAGLSKLKVATLGLSRSLTVDHSPLSAPAASEASDASPRPDRARRARVDMHELEAEECGWGGEEDGVFSPTSSSASASCSRRHAQPPSERFRRREQRELREQREQREGGAQAKPLGPPPPPRAALASLSPTHAWEAPTAAVHCTIPITAAPVPRGILSDGIATDDDGVTLVDHDVGQ